VRDLRGEISGPLRIATSHHIGLHRLPPVLSRFQRDYPAVQLDIEFLDSEQAYERLRAGSHRTGGSHPGPGRRVAACAVTLWVDPCGHGGQGSSRSRTTGAEPRRWRSIPRCCRAWTPSRARSCTGISNAGAPLQLRLATNYLETLRMMAGGGPGLDRAARSMAGEDLHTPAGDGRSADAHPGTGHAPRAHAVAGRAGVHRPAAQHRAGHLDARRRSGWRRLPEQRREARGFLRRQSPSPGSRRCRCSAAPRCRRRDQPIAEAETVFHRDTCPRATAASAPRAPATEIKAQVDRRRGVGRSRCRLMLVAAAISARVISAPPWQIPMRFRCWLATKKPRLTSSPSIAAVEGLQAIAEAQALEARARSLPGGGVLSLIDASPCTD
jgi:DNA-binding transcriptional LysR family regulator